MTVLIKVDQAAHPAGVPGQAREDLATGMVVTLTAVGGPFLAYQWSIISKPIDILTATQASSLLGSPTANTSTLSPIDVAGTYLIQISVDSGAGLGAGAGDVSRITFYAGPTLATDPTELPRREMAAFESTEHNVPDAIQPLGNTEGWSREWLRWFASIRRSVTLTLAATVNSIANTLSLRNSLGELVARAFVSGADDTSWTAGNKLMTTDATPAAILDIPFGDDAVFTGSLQLLADTPGVGLFQGWSVGGILFTTAGVLQAPTGVPVTTTFTSYVGPQPSFDFVYAANLLTLRVIGIAATNIQWVARVDAMIQLTP